MTYSTSRRASPARVLRVVVARLIAAAACAGLLSTACDVHGPSEPGALSAIVVSPNPQTLAANGAMQFTAVGTDYSGAVVRIAPVWTVASGGGAISGSGMFTAGSTSGTFANTVTATAGGLSASATIIVTSSPLASIVVAPNPTTLSVTAVQQFTAVGRDIGGNVVAITPVWSVANGGGTIDAGVFTAGTTPGTFTNTVTATSGGLTGTATVIITVGPVASITVTPNPASMASGATQQFTAVGRDIGGNVVPIVPAWSVVNGGGAIDVATGLFTAGSAAGTFVSTVRATSGLVSGTATVTVTPGSLATIIVTPNTTSIAVGGVQQFIAIGKDASGNVVSFTPTWSAVAGGGTLNGTGLFTASSAAGTFTNTVQASSNGIKGTATVTITSGGLATVVVAPNPTTLSVTAVRQFTATGRDASGNVVAITPVWSVVNGGGTIGAGGVFTAGTTPGTFINTVSATSGGLTGTATVIVTVGPVATITVTPNPVSVATGATQQFTAVSRDIGGNVVPIVPNWSVANGGGAIDVATGLFTAGGTPGTFLNTVKATSGLVSGTATVTVTPGLLATIVVTPNPASLAIGATQQFTAVGRDIGGNVVAITPVWSVANGGGTSGAGGAFTAGTTPGTFTNTVTATSGGLTGTATVIVTVGPVASITVTPNPASMATGATQQFIAVGRDLGGNVVPIVPAWSIVNGGGAIDVATGLFTAGGAAGRFVSTVQATSGLASSTATVDVVRSIPPPFVDLGSASVDGIMAGTTVTCVALGTINAKVSVSPGAAVTGFPPCVITGGVPNLADATAAQQQIDLGLADDALRILPCGTVIAADLGGTTKLPGVYCSGAAMALTGVLTLNGNGDPNAVFVFQLGTALTTAGDVVLVNGAQAKNVYWQVGSSATLGTASHLQGNIFAFTSVTLVDNATVIGRVLARNGAVTLGTGNTITLP